MPFIGSVTGNYSFGKGSTVPVAPPLTGDPYYSYVSLLLHMNGLNGSTVFTDTSPTPKIVTPYGGAQISTADFRFGGSSGYFNNTDAYLTVPDSTALNLSIGDWTVELFANISPVEADIIINKGMGVGYFPFQIRVINSRFNARGYLSTLGLGFNLGVGTGPIINPGIWNHIALCRQSNTFYLYVNGSLIESAVHGGSLYNSPASLSIAGTNNGLGLMSGYIEELRITKGICRYPNGTAFSPPNKQFFDSLPV